MERVFNFSAGPSMLPETVLKKAARELLNYNNTGQSVMEMSHRSIEFKNILVKTKALLCEIMNIPENYKVLFLQGGASSQFAMVPLNLMTKNNKSDYVITGSWATKAYLEATNFGNCNIIASSKDKNFSYIPDLNFEDFSKDADYVHICLNNTIYGTKFNKIPDTGDIPLIADISSCILSEPIDVSKFGLLYAGAQKNLAPAGLTIVIIREDLIGNPMSFTPTMFNYKVHASSDSLYNTPPCYNIYICMLVLEWIKNEMGGLENIKKLNYKKAKLIYNYLDSSKLFHGFAEPKDRSTMNVVFSTLSDKLDKQFIAKSKNFNIININGHRKIGGMRASIYNAMPIEGVMSLVEFMEKFEKKYLD